MEEEGAGMDQGTASDVGAEEEVAAVGMALEAGLEQPFGHVFSSGFYIKRGRAKITVTYSV